MELEEIYLKYRKQMICIADRILNDKYLAEDAVQIAIIKVFENYDKIKKQDEKTIKAYISVVVSNIAKTLYKVNKKEQIKIDKVKEAYISNSSTNNENNVENKVISKIYFSEKMSKLQERDKYLINLKYNFDPKNRDIAKILNMDEKLVSKKIRKIEKSMGKDEL